MAKKRKKPKRPQRAEDIADFIIDVDDASPWVRALVYGHNGTEKTRFAATAPNVLLIDIQEEGSMSAQGIQVKGAVKVFPAKTWQDVVLAYWYLAEGDHEFESFAIDTVTTMADVCMKRVIKEKYERDPNRDPKTPSQRDYGTQYTLMRDQLMAFRNLPMHMILLAQERQFGDPEEGEPIRHVPDLPTRARGAAMGAVGIIGRTFQREVKIKKGPRKGERVWVPLMLVGPHEDYESKDRTGQLGHIIKRPTVPMMIEAVEKKANKDKE